MEINLNFFKLMRPDIVILERKNEGDDIGDYEKCLKGPGKMLYIVEVKKVEATNSKSKTAEIIPSYHPSQSNRGRKPANKT